jgi:hypothetical protein
LLLLLVFYAALVHCKWYDNNNCEQVVFVVDFMLGPTLKCKSIELLDEKDMKVTLYRRNQYVSYPYMIDNPRYDLCDSEAQAKLFNSLGVSSCEDYFCNSQMGNLTRLRDKKEVFDYARMKNYCQYCSRPDFDSFHVRVLNGTCPLFQFASSDFCHRLQNGYPFVVSKLLLEKYEDPYICKCDHRFGYRCDGYTIFLMPVAQILQPIVMMTVLFVTFIVSLLLCVMPTLVKDGYQMVSSIRNNGQFFHYFKKFLTLRLIMLVFLCLHVLFLGLENLFSIPLVNLDNARYHFGPGVFRATALLCLYVDMLSLFATWVKILYQADSLNTSGVPILFKIILCCGYILLCILEIFPLLNINRTIRHKEVMNFAFFPMTFASVLLFAVGFLVYGFKLYFRIRRMQRLTIFQIKFTKFMMIVAVLLFSIFIQMLFVIIEFTGKRSPYFGVGYNLVDFPLLDWSFFFVVCAVTYQLTDWNQVPMYVKYSYWKQKWDYWILGHQGYQIVSQEEESENYQESYSRISKTSDSTYEDISGLEYISADAVSKADRDYYRNMAAQENKHQESSNMEEDIEKEQTSLNPKSPMTKDEKLRYDVIIQELQKKQQSRSSSEQNTSAH